MSRKYIADSAAVRIERLGADNTLTRSIEYAEKAVASGHYVGSELAAFVVISATTAGASIRNGQLVLEDERGLESTAYRCAVEEVRDHVTTQGRELHCWIDERAASIGGIFPL